MKKYIFSYRELEDFLQYAKKILPIKMFKEYNEGDKCIILRHDADLDFYPSYDVYKIEKKLGVKSTFFVLITSPTYNPQSSEIRKLLREMVADGFEIGLHFDPMIYGNIPEYELQTIAENECIILEEIVGKQINSIALHNPSFLNTYTIFDGYINAYSKEFFEDKRYISDSMRVDPLQHPYRGKDPYNFVKSAKDFPLQIVLHPEQFLPYGGSYLDVINRYNIRTIDKNAIDYEKVLSQIREKKL